MAEDPFKALKEARKDFFVAPRPYSFDLNEDMLKLIREEFNAEGVASKLSAAISGKAMSEVEKIGKEIFEEHGENWMRRTVQLGEEYSDRTIEVILEAVDRKGNQFLYWPLAVQRFVEIAYLGTQEFLKLSMVMDNQDEMAYKIPQCLLFRQIKEKCGDEVANLMTCKNACLKALETLRNDKELDAVITMEASTAEDGYCEFLMKKV